VKGVCSGLRCGVDHRSVAAELGAVCVGERLELRDRFDSERCARDCGTGSSLPPVLDVFAVKQARVSLGARPGNGLSRCASDQRAAASRRIRQRARRQQDQLFEIPAVQRQFAHLNLIYK